MTMGRRKKKVSVRHFSSFVEEAAQELFVDADPLDTPAYTYCYELWDRLCICAVLDQRASEVPLVALDLIRKQCQKRYKRPVALVMFLNPQEWSWKKSEERVVQLLTEHGGEAQ